MTTKIYKNYKTISNFLKKNNLLNAQLYIPTESDTYVSITGIHFIKPPHRRGQNSNMMVKFETFDRNSGELSIKQYRILLKYLRELQISKGAYYAVQHHIDPLTTKDTVNYIQGIISFPIKLIRHTFTFHKNTMYECELLGNDGETIYLLLSPTLRATWITKLSTQAWKLNKRNLKNLLVLIQHHLINDMYALYTRSKHSFTLNIFNSYNVILSQDLSTLRIGYETGNIALNLDKANTYLIDTDKHSPALKITYPNDHLTYYIILMPIFNRHLLPTLIQ